MYFTPGDEAVPATCAISEEMMKALSVLLVVALLALPSAFAATCSNASLNGVFGFLNNGYDSPTQLGASVGQYKFDGAGNVSGSFTHNNGTASTATFTGTYTVSTNCRGSMVLNISGGVTETENFAIDNTNKGIQTIRADAGQIKPGFAVANGTETCGLTGVRQTFAVNFTGTNIGQGPVAYVGQVIFDGKGTLSGSATLSFDGSVGTLSLTGTYTENSDCTGTAIITPKGLNSGNFNFVVVNGGRQSFLIQTDSNDIVTGTAQQ